MRMDMDRIKESLEEIKFHVDTLSMGMANAAGMHEAHKYMLTHNAERIKEIEGVVKRIEQGTIERDLALRDRYNDILGELVSLKNILRGAAEEHLDIKRAIEANTAMIGRMAEEKHDRENDHIARMKAMIRERISGDAEKPLSTGELKSLAEAANIIAEAEAKINGEKRLKGWHP